MKSTTLCILVLVVFSLGQNHPNSDVIERVIDEWDGTFPIRFAVVGDNYCDNFIFRSILKQIQHIDTLLNFVITTGDHAAGGDSAGYWNYISKIDSLTVPWITVMGNHEINDSLGWDRFIDYFGYPDFYFDLGDARFVALTDCYPAPEVVSGTENVYYKFTPEQLDWLEDVLGEWHGLKFIFIHAPPYLEGHIIVGTLGSFGYSPDYEGSLTERFTDILKNNDVFVCFCGHIHCYDRWTPNNEAYGDVTYIITGGAGGDLTPWPYGEPYGGGFFHFLIMELREDGTLLGHIVRPDTIDDGITIVEYDTIYDFSLTPPTSIHALSKKPSAIEKPYPNPFNSAVWIPAQSDQKTVSIKDITGKIISSIPAEGVKQVIWEPGDEIPSGIYIANGNVIFLIR